MVVGIGKIDLYIPASRSLKDKRRVLRRIKDRTFNRFKVQLAEVDLQDVWQRAQLGFSVVGNDRRVIQSLMDRLFDFVAECGDAQIVDQWGEVENY